MARAPVSLPRRRSGSYCRSWLARSPYRGGRAASEVSEQSVGNWNRQFLEAGKTGLAAGKSGPSTQEQQPGAEVWPSTRPRTTQQTR
jgi:hypothetical protein